MFSDDFALSKDIGTKKGFKKILGLQYEPQPKATTIFKKIF
jgi:hypothetical protein